MDREPPEPPICVHWAWAAYDMLDPSDGECQEGVKYADVAAGPLSIAALPCLGLSETATCEKRKCPEPPKMKPEPSEKQGVLF